MDKEIMAKGFINASKQWIDLLGQKQKLALDDLETTRKMKQNYMWKVMENKAEQNNRLELAKKIQAQTNQDSEEGNFNIESPRMQMSATGEPVLNYPSARDKEFNIKLGLNRIALKEKKFSKTQDERFKLTPQEQSFKETYSGMISGPGTTTVPSELKPLSLQATEEEKQSFLSSFPPEKQEIIKGIADYTLDPAKTSSLFRSNERQTMIGLTKMYNPNFDMKAFTAAQQYQNPNTKIGQNVASLNTLVGHIGYLKSAIENLKASGQPLENAVVLTARNLTGDPTITNYDQAKEVVDNELQRALTGVGVTQEGMARQGGILPSRKFGTKQAEQYIKALSHILDTRLGILETGYRQQVRRDPENLIRYPETKEILNNIMENNQIDNSGGLRFSEEDIQHTLKLHPEYTRDTLMKKLGGQ